MIRGRRGVLAVVAAAALALSPLVVLPAAGASRDTGVDATGSDTGPSGAEGVTAVRATDETVELAGTAQPGAQVALHALGTESDPTQLDEASAVLEVEAGDDGTFTASLPRVDGTGADRLYDQFVAAAGGAPLGGARYVDDYAMTPLSDLPRPLPRSMKGVVVAQLTDDAEQLGLGHSLVNVTLNRVMVPAALPGGATTEFSSGGRTWWFDTARIAELDRQLRVLTDNGVVPSVILKVEENRVGRDVPELVHPDALPGVVPGEQYMMNTATPQGVAAFTAAVEFLTQRWTRPDGAYGLVPDWIVGNEVDSAWKWMNMGEATLPEFVEDYGRAVRIVDQAAHRAYSGARAFVPMTYCWTISCDRNPVEAEPTRYYPGRDLVEQLTAGLAAEGDVGWGIAYHPYPESIVDPRAWEDTEATDDFATRRITPRNIDVLPRYMAQEHLLFRGQRRPVAATEWGCNTLSPAQEDLDVQAACFAYSAYRMRFTEGIEWFNYFRDLDYELTSSSPLQVGLWATDPAQPDVTQPVGDPKPIYDVMRYIDTERSLEVTTPYLDEIGVSDWSEVIPGFDPEALDTRELATTAGAQLGGELRGGRPLGPAAGTSGWVRSDNAVTLAPVDPGVRVVIDAKAAKQRSGARLDLDTPADLTGAPVLSLRVRTDGDTRGELESDATWSATVRVYGADGRRLDAQARVRPDGTWQRISVDLSGWASRAAVSAVKVQMSASSNRRLRAAFDVADVASARAVLPTGPRSVNLGLTASVVADEPADVAVGDVLSVTVEGWGVRSPAGAGTVIGCDGLAAAPSTVPLAGLRPGARRTTELRLTAFDPTDPEPTLCLQVGDQVLTAPVDLDPPPPPPAPPAPDGHPAVEVSDTFDADSAQDYTRFAMQPEGDVVPTTTVGGGVLTATAGEDWFGAFRTSVAPSSARISTVLEIDSFAPDGIGNVVYTGLVKDERNAIVGLYVKSARYAAFEVRVDGVVRLTNQVTDLDLEDGMRLGFSLDGPSASLWVDRGAGAGWELLADTVLRGVPDLSDPQELAQWRYAFSLRSLAGETISAGSFEGRSRP